MTFYILLCVGVFYPLKKRLKFKKHDLGNISSNWPAKDRRKSFLAWPITKSKSMSMVSPSLSRLVERLRGIQNSDKSDTG